VTPFLHHGATTILLRKFDPEQVVALSAKEKATLLFGVPTTMEMMARAQSFADADLSSVRYAIVGGEPMPIPLIHTWADKGVPVRQGYGMTEFGPNNFSLQHRDSIRKAGSIGFANFYVQTRIVDANGSEVATGHVGELWLRGPACFPGYWRNVKATHEALADGWYHTGDLVRCDNEGYFYVVGRKKDMFISGGENVYPVEIETFLRTHPHVSEVAVIGVPDAKWGEVGKAFVVIKAGCAVDGPAILNFCYGNLARYKIPKHIAFVADLPKGDSGKILKRELPRD
jgi:fatty-acyl-CoA synthase